MWKYNVIFPTFFHLGCFIYKKVYKLFKGIPYVISLVKGSFTPFLFIHDCIHSPSRVIFSAAIQSWILSCIHFGQLFQTLCTAQISIIFYYLYCCHFYKNPCSLFFVKIGASFRFHLLKWHTLIFGLPGGHYSQTFTRISVLLFIIIFLLDLNFQLLIENI